MGYIGCPCGDGFWTQPSLISVFKRGGCRLEWPKDQYFPPCVLTFREGWEPPPLAMASRDQDLTQLAESLADARRQEDLQRLAQEVSIAAAACSFLLTNRKLMPDFLFVFA